MYSSIILGCQTKDKSPVCEDCFARKTCRLHVKPKTRRWKTSGVDFRVQSELGEDSWNRRFRMPKMRRHHISRRWNRRHLLDSRAEDTTWHRGRDHNTMQSVQEFDSTYWVQSSWKTVRWSQKKHKQKRKKPPAPPFLFPIQSFPIFYGIEN